MLPAVFDQTTWMTIHFGTALTTVKLLVLAALAILVVANGACRAHRCASITLAAIVECAARACIRAHHPWTRHGHGAIQARRTKALYAQMRVTLRATLVLDGLRTAASLERARSYSRVGSNRRRQRECLSSSTKRGRQTAQFNSPHARGASHHGNRTPAGRTRHTCSGTAHRQAGSPSSSSSRSGIGGFSTHLPCHGFPSAATTWHCRRDSAMRRSIRPWVGHGRGGKESFRGWRKAG